MLFLITAAVYFSTIALRSQTWIYCNPHDVVSCASAITKYFKNQDRFEDILKYNQNKIKEFDIEKVTHMMERELEHI